VRHSRRKIQKERQREAERETETDKEREKQRERKRHRKRLLSSGSILDLPKILIVHLSSFQFDKTILHDVEIQWNGEETLNLSLRTQFAPSRNSVQMKAMCGSVNLLTSHLFFI
jgi:hypothetical protein